MAVAATVLTLALAACSSAASPTPGSSAAASMSMGSVASTAPSASQSGTARCAVTSDATGSATIELASFAFGPAVTIKAGQAVVFTNKDGTAHTVTEGTGGSAASSACVDQRLAAGSSVTVTFSQPGDYQITCKIHSSMQTVVHVQ